MATEDKLLNGVGLSRFASDIKAHVRDQAEVYVGPTAPTSGNYKIWVDTDEVASDYIKSGDNISKLNNNSGYITSSYHDSTKQDTLTAGTNIDITNNVISATDTTYSEATTTTSGLMSSADKTKLNGVSSQAKYVSASNTGTSTNEVNYLTIDSTEYKIGGSGSGEPAAYLKSASTSGNTLTLTNKDDTTTVFTPTDTTYTAGDNVQISNTNVISATDTKYTAGTNVSITDNVISATDTKYTAGENVNITGNVISATDTKYTAGTNVNIAGTTISATDTKYTAGSGINIDSNNVISATGTTGGTVTSVTAGTGLTGGTITTSGTIAVDTSTIATKTYVDGAVDDMATQTWVENKGYLTSHQSLAAYRTSSAQDEIDATKQGTLTAGTNITIDPLTNTISANTSGGTVTGVTAGNGLIGGTITTSGTIAVDTTVVQPKLIAGTNITIDQATNTISATGGAGGGVTSVTAGSGLTGGTITTSGTIAVDTSVIQPKLTAGANITITGNTISATDTTYTNATTSSSGLMSSSDKVKLNGLKSVSGTNDGTNWTTITIDGTTKNIPTGGGSGGVTSITAGTGLTGGTITTSGTIGVDTNTIATKNYVTGLFSLSGTTLTITTV